MKRFLLLVITSLAVSSINGQKTSTIKKNFMPGAASGDVRIVVIKSREIPNAVQKSLSAPDSSRIHERQTTIYTNPSNQVHVVHVTSPTENQAYIFQKNSDVILMLRAPKPVATKPVGFANK